MITVEMKCYSPPGKWQRALCIALELRGVGREGNQVSDDDDRVRRKPTESADTLFSVTHTQ